MVAPVWLPARYFAVAIALTLAACSESEPAAVDPLHPTTDVDGVTAEGGGRAGDGAGTADDAAMSQCRARCRVEDTTAGIQRFVKNLVGFYVIMEGVFFYSGFVMMLAFHRQNRMTGVGEQFQYILRDETIHLNFGIDLINGVKAENPEIWTTDFQRELGGLIEQAVELEIAYAEDCLPRGILGLNATMFREYVQHIADRRMERIGIPPKYGSKNPFPWMSETIDLGKEKNFFETRVTEYQTGGALEW